MQDPTTTTINNAAADRIVTTMAGNLQALADSREQRAPSRLHITTAANDDSSAGGLRGLLARKQPAAQRAPFSPNTHA